MCSVEGCFGMAIDDEFCPRCRQELNALEAWERMRQGQQLCRELRREARAERLRRACRWIGKVIWVPELTFVVGMIVYVGSEFGFRLLKWAVCQ